MIGDRRRQKFTLLPLKGGRGGAKSPVARKDMRTVRERERLISTRPCSISAVNNDDERPG